MITLKVLDLLLGVIGIIILGIYLQRKENTEEETQEYTEEDDSPKYPEITISGGCRITRERVNGTSDYRDMNGVLRHQFPRTRIEVELDDPVECPEDVCQVTITSVSPGITFLGYITSDRKKIIEY